MDPNELLKRLIAWAEDTNLGQQAIVAHLAAQDFIDLHEWLVRGGFKPDMWDPKS